MPRIIGGKLIADLNRSFLLVGVQLDLDGSNLPRLDDFFKEKVAGRASRRSSGSQRDSSNEKRIIRAP
jgi:hypothetical protein